MTTDDDLGRALADSLTYVGSQARPSRGLVERLTEGVGARPGRRGGVRWAPLAAVAAVLALLALTGVVVLRHDPIPVGEPARTGAPPTYGSRSAASLASARWTSLPDAPIQGRRSAVGVWTGSQMLVWGGVTTTKPERPLADGASYDPATRAWRTLPAAPLSARSSTASVWTGTVLFVWGGAVSPSGSRVDSGATYDPVARTWHRLPAAPVAQYQQAVALVVGDSVVLLTTPPGDDVRQVQVQSYRPDTDTWTRLPDLDLPVGQGGAQIEAVSTGDRILLWSMWSHTVPIDSPGANAVYGTSTTSGIDGFTYDVVQQRWTRNRLGEPVVASVRQPLWTGSEVLLPAAQRFCGGCQAPAVTAPGRRLVPSSGASTAIPLGPVDEAVPEDVWTGAALLAVNTGAQIGGPGGLQPGAAAVWDPTKGGWVRLPDAPWGGTDGVVVWTGHSLIVWGTFFRGQDSTWRTGGLELG